MPIVISRGLRMTAVGSMKVAVDGLGPAALIGRLTGVVAYTPAIATSAMPIIRRLATCAFIQATLAILESSRRSRSSTRGDCLMRCLWRTFIVPVPHAKAGLTCAGDAGCTPGPEYWPSSDVLLEI